MTAANKNALDQAGANRWQNANVGAVSTAGPYARLRARAYARGRRRLREIIEEQRRADAKKKL